MTSTSVGIARSRGAGVALAVAVLALHAIAVLDTTLRREPAIWPLHNDTVHRVGRSADFYSVYHAAMQIDRGLSPFSMAFDGVTPYYYPFRYLPVVATAATPLTQLAPLDAYYVWVAVLELVLASLIFALHAHLRDRRTWLLVSSLLLLSSPYLLEVYLGQFTFVAMGLCALALLTAPRIGAVLYSLSVLLKMFPLVIAPALVRRRRDWPMLLLAVVSVVALSAPHFLAHPGDLREFVDGNLEVRHGMDAGNHGLLYALNLLGRDLGLPWLLEHWPAVAASVRWIVLAATALAVLFARTERTLLGACALGFAHFVSYAQVWEHHMTAVMVLGAVLLVAQQTRRSDVISILACLCVLAVPTPFVLLDVHKDPAVWNPADQWPRYASYLALLPKLVPTLGLFALALLRLGEHGFSFTAWRTRV